mmetsp:Transcript_33394/g.52216  ORF Transcript_33394/g.52216 Transcript_33394/m.52216 type:complete len:187 (-) Transcript_33394:44-604(-)
MKQAVERRAEGGEREVGKEREDMVMIEGGEAEIEDMRMMHTREGRGGMKTSEGGRGAMRSMEEGGMEEEERGGMIMTKGEEGERRGAEIEGGERRGMIREMKGAVREVNMRGGARERNMTKRRTDPRGRKLVALLLLLPLLVPLLLTILRHLPRLLRHLPHLLLILLLLRPKSYLCSLFLQKASCN